ncbi:MAG: type II toxin-antitoxin system VapC family toxin [Planctomycetes bacterium]|nr:type II toxin-antitoxin system VapC family toxin [Planctomycetota bacterium]
MKIYLDNSCFNRPFDDQKQLRIKLETEAKLNIQERILEKGIELAWSYILDFENEANPFEHRRLAIRGWKNHASVDTDETQEIVEKAERFHRMGIKSKDSLHLACAISMQCEYLLTTDDELVKKAEGIKEIKVTDPISFIKEGTE